MDGLQRRRAVCRAELLSPAPDHRDSGAATRRGTEAAIDLDGFFGLHPSLQPLEGLFHNGQMAVVQAVGSPDPTRSHLDAQDFNESGTPGVKATDDGWLNRALQSMSGSLRRLHSAPWPFGPYLPRTLEGTGASRGDSGPQVNSK